MCFPLFHFQSLILLPSHHTSDVDDALVLWLFFPCAVVATLPVFLLARRLCEVKDVLFRSLLFQWSESDFSSAARRVLIKQMADRLHKRQVKGTRILFKSEFDFPVANGFEYLSTHEIEPTYLSDLLIFHSSTTMAGSSPGQR